MDISFRSKGKNHHCEQIVLVAVNKYSHSWRGFKADYQLSLFLSCSDLA